MALSKSTLKPFRMSHSLTVATDSVHGRTLQLPEPGKTYARIPLDQKKNTCSSNFSLSGDSTRSNARGMPVGDVDKPIRGAINEQWLFLYRKLPRSRCDTLIVVRPLKSNTGNVTNSSGTKKKILL